ncbi:MAG: methionyl-tRNA formyltransferase [Acidimicrobiia bacterium]|nr:MAG: methionyl-tRNA formyltransferase [Acidimicrobiia bacterium]
MAGIFLGTPAAAVPSLAAFCDVEDVELVITQPDRRAGRGSEKAVSSVKKAAEQFGFEVAQPETGEELFDLVASIRPDIALVVAYGRILKPAVLSVPPYGFLNVHFSLLPRWRGAAPVERAIAAGDETTGVTLMHIDPGLDTGPILGEISTPIGPGETGGSLTARLSFLGATLVDRMVPDFMNGRRRPVPQLAAGVTHAAKLEKDEARLNSTWDVAQAERAVRAFTPRPGAWIRTKDGDLKIHAATIASVPATRSSIEVTNGVVTAGFRDGSLELRTVQAPGKASQSASVWMNGRRGIPLAFASDDD